MTYYKWKKKGKIISGKATWIWHSQHFYIQLNSFDPITGFKRCFYTIGENDCPNFNGWKIIKGK